MNFNENLLIFMVPGLTKKTGRPNSDDFGGSASFLLRHVTVLHVSWDGGSSFYRASRNAESDNDHCLMSTGGTMHHGKLWHGCQRRGHQWGAGGHGFAVAHSSY